MMESLERCRLIYLNLTNAESDSVNIKENVDNTNNNNYKDWIYLKKMIRDELLTLKFNEKFRHGIFDCLLNEGFIARQPKWDYRAVSMAFEHLEKYCRLLRIYPWKTEYHTLKTYGGFFRTYILSVLPGCMEILRIIGYSPLTEGPRFNNRASVKPKMPVLLKLDSLPPRSSLLETVGFDCLAASVECELRFEAQISRSIRDSIRVANAIPSEFKIHNKYLSNPRTKSNNNLPKERDAYTSPCYLKSHIRSDEVVRGVGVTHNKKKTRSYFAEQLDYYQKQQNNWNLENDIDLNLTLKRNTTQPRVSHERNLTTLPLNILGDINF